MFQHNRRGLTRLVGNVLVWLPLALSLCAGVAFAQQQDRVILSPELPTIPQRRIAVTDYGAIGDGKTLNTEAFRKAIAACRAAGGCEVHVPAGIFVSGPIEMTSKMALVLEKGATIRGSEKFSDFDNSESQDKIFTESKAPSLPLIRAGNVTDVAIRGEGTIDGAGLPWWQRFRAERAAGAPQQGQVPQPGQPTAIPRPRMIWFVLCTRVHVQGVTLKDAPQFHLVPYLSHEVTIEDVKVLSPADSPNTDGIDPTGSRNVLIRRCYIDVGDDNVSFKSNPKEEPLDNVLVTDCTFKHGHGASVGSNIGGGIRNITVQNCTFEGTDNGIRIKSTRDRGGVVENITYRNLTMKNVGVAITINLFYFDKKGEEERKALPVTPLTPSVKNVRIINVTVAGAKTAGEIIGLPEMPIDNVLLDHIRITAKTGMTLQDAKAVELRDVQIIPQTGEPLTIRNAEVKKAVGSRQ
jgi:polygalacturonase